MSKQKGFTKEFEDEAVRLALTSGRTRRELAENLGVGLSTLTRWIGRRRDRAIDFPDKGRTEDAAEELKRPRHGNTPAILHGTSYRTRITQPTGLIRQQVSNS